MDYLIRDLEEEKSRLLKYIIVKLNRIRQIDELIEYYQNMYSSYINYRGNIKDSITYYKDMTGFKYESSYKFVSLLFPHSEIDYARRKLMRLEDELTRNLDLIRSSRRSISNLRDEKEKITNEIVELNERIISLDDQINSIRLNKGSSDENGRIYG